jgi:hypothetical protein
MRSFAEGCAVRSLLLKAYPRSWREEYGEELAAILAKTRLTPGLMGDVLINAAIQRWRRAEPWMQFALVRFGGGCLGACLGLVIGLTGHSIGVSTGYSWANALDLPMFLVFGGYVYLHKRRGIWEGASSSLKVTLASEIPFVLGFLVWGLASQQLPRAWADARQMVQFAIPQSMVAGLTGAVLTRLYLRLRKTKGITSSTI